MAETLQERLRDVGCDHEPFTDAHAKCICRLAGKAADLIDEAQQQLHYAVDAKNWDLVEEARALLSGGAKS